MNTQEMRLKLVNLIKSPTIHLALATAVSIIVLAYVSKKVLPRQMSNIELALIPTCAMFYDLLLKRKGNSKFLKPIYGIIGIIVLTILIIAYHLFIAG